MGEDGGVAGSGGGGSNRSSRTTTFETVQTDASIMGDEAPEPLAWWTYAGVAGLWFATNRVLSAGGVTGEGAYLLVAAAFIGTFGVACLVNGQRCGALHCRVSGPGYLAVAGLALVGATGLVEVSQTVVIVLFGVVVVASYAVELLADGAGAAAGT